MFAFLLFVYSLFQIDVSDLEFWNYSIRNLKFQEKVCAYPPRYKANIKYLEEHSSNFNIEFKISLETDGVLSLDRAQNIPIPIKGRGIKSGIVRIKNRRIRSYTIILMYRFLKMHNTVMQFH